MDGKTHDKVTKYLCPVTAIAYSAISGDPFLGFVAGAGELFGGLYLSPDLDIKSNPFYRWGALRWFWLPYQKSIPHRHWLSHSVLIGSVGRVLYLLFPALLILIITNNLGMIESINYQVLITGFVGIEVSAIAHLICDYLPKGKHGN